MNQCFNDPEAHQLLSSIICFFLAQQDMTVESQGSDAKHWCSNRISVGFI